MDKNTLLGILLMGAVIFGFMYLSKPSKEQQERQLKEQQEQLARQQSEAAAQGAAQEKTDTLTREEVASLAPLVKQNGAADSLDGRIFHLVNDEVNLTCDSARVTGRIRTGGYSIDIADVISRNLSAITPQQLTDAVAVLRKTIDDLNRYKEFAKYLSGENQTVTLENDHLAVELSTRGGVISKVTLKEYETYVNADTANVTLINGADDSYSFMLSTASQRLETKEFNFIPVQENDSTLLMKLDLGEGAMWGMRYTLERGSYLVRLDIVQENMQRIVASNTSTMEFDWHLKMARNEKGKTFEERNSGIFYKYLGDTPSHLSENSDDKQELKQPVKWIAFKNQFFSSVVIPEGSFSRANLVSKNIKNVPGYLKEMTATASIDYSPADHTAPRQHFYFGPNTDKQLNEYSKLKVTSDENLELPRLIPLGWTLFRWINTIIIIPVFNFLGKFIPSYGIIILLLTIFIKIILFPFTYKSYQSQAKMRVLQPEVKAINDKYPGKENAMARQQKTMELYSKAGASPFSGCLPMILQLPVLVAMFSFFPCCLELRGQAFLWAKDLSAPDAIVSWTTQIPLISSTYGNHISLFCLLMTVVNIIYTRTNMQTQPDSSSMPGMKWMMYLMPVLFLFWFNDYSSGLSYYYFLSLLITIVQTYVFRKVINEKKVRAKMMENTKKPKKKSGFMARLEEAQRKQQAMIREQQKQQQGRKGRRQ